MLAFSPSRIEPVPFRTIVSQKKALSPGHRLLWRKLVHVVVFGEAHLPLGKSVTHEHPALQADASPPDFTDLSGVSGVSGKRGSKIVNAGLAF